MTFFPYGRQSIDSADIGAVTEALISEYLTTGPLVEKYEAALRQATGAPFVVSCNSGTAALHLAMLALGVKPDDVVIVPAITFVATANVARMCGASVVFADVDPDSGLVTPDTMTAAQERAHNIGPVSAAFAVHLNGQLCAIDQLKSVLATTNTLLVEDAAHAFGAKFRWDGLGAGAACFSTHPVKAIATGEGGFVAFADPSLARRAMSFRSHGITREPQLFQLRDIGFDGSEANLWHHEMHCLGWNYRLPDVLCALGLSQLDKLDHFIERRKQIASFYDEAFQPLFPVVRPVPRGEQPDGYHLYPLLIDFKRLGRSRNSLMRALRSKGIGTQVHYIPVHLQPYYRTASQTPYLPGAIEYFERCLSIPFYPILNDEQAGYIVREISESVSGET